MNARSQVGAVGRVGLLSHHDHLVRAGCSRGYPKASVTRPPDCRAVSSGDETLEVRSPVLTVDTGVYRP